MEFSFNTNEVEKLGGLELLAKQAVEGFITGIHKSPLHGFSVEFAEHRQYNTGESTKHIDWKLFARTDKLYTKKYEEETNLRCHLLLDTSSSMYYPQSENLLYNKLEFSIFCIASLIHLLKKQRDAFGLTTFSDKIDLHTEAKSSVRHQRYIFDALGRVARDSTAKKSTSIVDSLHQIAESIHKRSMVVIFSDMFGSVSLERSEELFFALQHLKHRKHEVLVFQVRDHHTEVNFDFEDGPYQFIDMETNEVVKVKSNEVKDSFVSSMKKYTDELKLKCAQYKIDYIQADINTDYHTVLREYLIKRQKML